MDTRSKIVTLAQAGEAARRLRATGLSIRLVLGFFDPLLPAHARRIGELALANGALFVLVTDPAAPVLPARARAELAAALAMVDYVVLAGEAGLEEVMRSIQPDAVFQEEAADQQRSLELIRHVHRRQSAR